MNSFYNPVKLIWGIGMINDLSDIIDKSNISMKRILVLTGRKSLELSGQLNLILEQLRGREFFIYNQIDSNPDIKDLYNIIYQTNKLNFDSIIAIGGGSVLDVGKALAAFKNININSSSELKEYIVNKKYQDYNIDTPIIAIPTTAGTGSEVTSWATIWDKEGNKKYSVEDIRLYSKIAILDPTVTKSIPLKLTTTTALDALSHALEAYWSKNTNEIVRLYSLKAIELIMMNINNLLNDLYDLNLRSRVMLGSLYAGLAFSNTKTTVCHSISYPLTLMYNIPHGIATSITLSRFLRINEKYIVNKELLLKAFGVKKVIEVEDIINNIYIKANIPYKLREYGIKREDIESIVNNSFTPGRVDNNPVKITKDVLRNVLEEIY